MQTIKKLGILSVAKIEGIIGVVIGFIIGVLFFVAGGVASSVTGSATQSSLASFGALSIIIFPVFYGIVLFIGGAVGAWIYNLAAGWIGGIQIELG